MDDDSDRFRWIGTYTNHTGIIHGVWADEFGMCLYCQHSKIALRSLRVDVNGEPKHVTCKMCKISGRWVEMKLDG
jgi:hypothetical protein